MKKTLTWLVASTLALPISFGCNASQKNNELQTIPVRTESRISSSDNQNELDKFYEHMFSWETYDISGIGKVKTRVISGAPRLEYVLEKENTAFIGQYNNDGKLKLIELRKNQTLTQPNEKERTYYEQLMEKLEREITMIKHPEARSFYKENSN